MTPGAEHVTRRILDLMRFPFAGWEDLDRRAEIFQMLHYGPGQEYRVLRQNAQQDKDVGRLLKCPSQAHTDWFAALGEDNCHDSEILRGRNRYRPLGSSETQHVTFGQVRHRVHLPV